MMPVHPSAPTYPGNVIPGVLVQQPQGYLFNPTATHMQHGHYQPPVMQENLDAYQFTDNSLFFGQTPSQSSIGQQQIQQGANLPVTVPMPQGTSGQPTVVQLQQAPAPHMVPMPDPLMIMAPVSTTNAPAIAMQSIQPANVSVTYSHQQPLPSHVHYALPPPDANWMSRSGQQQAMQSTSSGFHLSSQLTTDQMSHLQSAVPEGRQHPIKSLLELEGEPHQPIVTMSQR